MFVLVLTLAAIGAVTLLEQHADASHRAQLQVGTMNLALADLIVAPYRADPTAGGSPAAAQQEIRVDERVLSRGLLNASGVAASDGSLTAARLNLARVESVVAAIYRIAAQPTGINGNKQSSGMQKTLAIHKVQLSAVLERIDQTEAGRAQRARLEAAIGTAVAMLGLAGVFLIFYVRSRQAHAATERLARENQELSEASRIEASTDALTGLRSRRALTDHLNAGIPPPEKEPELLLAMFDLNGFKRFNDTFGHGAGDALLARLGGRLSTVADGSGGVYRMGGDEFCLLSRCTPQAAEAILAGAATALSECGEGWSISCSYGAVWIPSEASTASDALLAADQRMYANKAARSSASRQLTDVPAVSAQRVGQEPRRAHRSRR
jgi:diguanylate cyclase (GGDEF)-like protein